jgi:hypothetical protein
MESFNAKVYLVDVWNKGDLFLQAVRQSCPNQPRGGRLVRDASQEYIKVILEKWKVPLVFIMPMSSAQQ